MIMRKIPTLLAAFFILLNLGRVLTFAADGMKAGTVSGTLFSVALSAGVFIVAYWTRVSTLNNRTGQEDYRSRSVRKVAWSLLIFFVIVDGFFNLVEVWRVVQPQGWLMSSAVVLYGAFPTLAAAFLGALQGYIDRLPPAPSRGKVSIKAAVNDYIVRMLAGNGPEITEGVPAGSAELPEGFRKLPEPVSWRELDDGTKQKVSGMSTGQIVQEFGVSDRTARNWRASALSTNGNGNHKEE